MDDSNNAPAMSTEQLNAAVHEARGMFNNGDSSAAVQRLQQVLSQAPPHLDALLTLSGFYHQLGNHAAALEQLRVANEIAPNTFNIVLNKGFIESTLDLMDAAEASLQQAVAIEPANARAYIYLGMLYIQRNKLNEAGAALEQAVKLDPGSEEALCQLAAYYHTRGEKDQAIANYRKALAINPSSGQAYKGIADLQKNTPENIDIKRMQFVLGQPGLPEHQKMLLSFALGKALDDMKMYDKAFKHISAGNRLMRQTCNFSIDSTRALFDAHKVALAENFQQQMQGEGTTDNTPIFVLGMPRSGTSLVEQILASHPDVHGAGEVDYLRVVTEGVEALTGAPFPTSLDTIDPARLRALADQYIMRLRQSAPGAKRVVDKLTQNFLRIGMITAVMPNAKIILCERDPLDCCLSIYMHHFSAIHGYASDLEELGQYYKLFESLADHWMNILPGKVLRLSYAQLVSDPDNQVRQLLDYCELEFHEDCLNFHKTKRDVNTPSAAQVRQPIYKTALARWRNYEQQLQPLIKALQGG